jgi:hypothetical protein
MVQRRPDVDIGGRDMCSVIDKYFYPGLRIWQGKQDYRAFQNPDNKLQIM